MFSTSKKFIFIHICKTAGSSINLALKPYVDKRLPKGVHATISDYLKVLGPSLAGTFTFCVVRNPYDWMVSLYEYIRGEPTHWQHQEVAPLSFEEFVDYHIGAKGFKQSDWTHHEGQREVLFIARFENLNEDFAKISDLFDLKTSLPHVNKTAQRGAWRDYYTQELSEKVAAYLADDFAHFDYDTSISPETDHVPCDLNASYALPQLRDLIRQAQTGTRQVA